MIVDAQSNQAVPVLKKCTKSTTNQSFNVHEKSYSLNPGLFINNKFVSSISGKMFDSVNPATGKSVFSVYEADKEDVDVAVDAAKEAFKSWKNVPAKSRSRLMLKLADLMERDQCILAELESIDNGKAITVSSTEDVSSIDRAPNDTILKS